MQNSLCSINAFVYVSIFACLFNLAINDEEGYFFLTHSDTGKSWNITWDDSDNGKKMAEFIKNREEKQIELKFEFFSGFDLQAFRYNDDTDKLFNFGSFSGSIDAVSPYGIAVAEDKFLYFMIIDMQGSIGGKKVGKLKDGKNGLSDFNAGLNTNTENKNSFILGYQANSNPSSDASSDLSGDTHDENCNKWLIILILLILVLIFTALFFVFQ